MKVLHVTDSYLPTLGGIELHVRDLSARQRSRGDDVVIATKTPGAPHQPAAPDVLRAGGPGWLEGLAPDVVHAHVSIISPFALATARRAAYAGIPTVVTVHSIWTRVGPLPHLARDVWAMRDWPVTWTAVSARAAEPVHAVLGLPVHVVPNAVDVDAWPATVAPAGPPRVACVMRLTGVKRAMPLVRILREVADRADLRATIVGDGPQRAPMERYLRRHRLDDRVHLAGALDRPGIRSLLQGSSVFLAPAHRESFGIAALEARATGLPLVASSRSGVGSFVRHGREGLLGADDRELAAHTLALLTDPALRERIAVHNRGHRPAFGWAETVERCDDLYELAQTRARRPVARRPVVLR